MLLDILHYPDPRLLQNSAAVTVFDAALAKLAADMLETMYAAPGVGLAAPQVGVLKRLIVMDVSAERREPRVLVNPTIVKRLGRKQGEEGCLSVPGVFDEVWRSEHIEVSAHNLEGDQLSFEAEGLLAVCVQHEIDHLDGKVFVQYLSPIKQMRISRKLKKAAR